MPADDIPLHKQAEEQRRSQEQLIRSQKIEALGRLASAVAHEFNNLLTAISGHNQMALRRLSQADPNREDLQGIQVATDRAAALSRQLLAFSRNHVFQPCVVDLNRAAMDLAASIRGMLGENFELTITADEPPALIKADPGTIEQILRTLACRARDAAVGHGHLEILVRGIDAAQSATAPDPSLCILMEVHDDGREISPETLSRVFDPLSVLPATGRDSSLGLAAVAAMVHQLGGEIQVDSAPGRGTRFSIYLPRTQETSPAVPTGPSAIRERDHEPQTVLLAEDQDMVRNVLKRILRSEGYTVLEARHGVEALEIAHGRREPIDILVTDVLMPMMTGWELADHASSMHPEMRVLFISGFASQEQTGRAERRPVDFLQKPFLPEDLTRKIREILDRSEAMPA